MNDLAAAFRDLAQEDYPFTVRALNAGGVEVWSATVEGPGALEVPPLVQEHGPVSIELTFPRNVVRINERGEVER